MIDSDVLLVGGLLIAAFAIPAGFSAFSEGRPPRAAAVALALGAVLVAVAVFQRPGGYSPDQIPAAFARVAARLLR